jgi:hypothetical protein
MPLKLTLKPDERLVINGCVIRNSSRRQVLTIESPMPMSFGARTFSIRTMLRHRSAAFTI